MFIVCIYIVRGKKRGELSSHFIKVKHTGGGKRIHCLCSHQRRTLKVKGVCLVVLQRDASGDVYNQCRQQKVTVIAIVKDKSSPSWSAFRDSMMNSTAGNV